MEAREYLHPLRQYECRECSHLIQIETPMTQVACFSFQGGCTFCGKVRIFDMIFSPTYITFGMYTKRYTGQEAAVNGWGTHGLDYSNPKSDLIAGRATEAAKNNPPKVRS